MQPFQQPQLSNPSILSQPLLSACGEETYKKFSNMRIIVLGLTGLGIEIARNLTLMHPKSLSLYDNVMVEPSDISSNMFLTEPHIGTTTRAQASLNGLQSLNPSCDIRVVQNNSVSFIASNFDCVVVVDNYEKEYLIGLNKECRDRKVGFVMAGCLGGYVYTFTDFGLHHRITSPSDQPPLQAYITHITHEENATVHLFQDIRHNLQTGDTIIFSEIEGMDELNGRKYKVRVDHKQQIGIGDTRGFKEYKYGGVVRKVERARLMGFNSLEQNLQEQVMVSKEVVPFGFDAEDGQNLSESLHIILLGMYDFYSKHQRLPLTLGQAQADEFLSIIQSKQLQSFNSFNLSNPNTKTEHFCAPPISPILTQTISLFARTQIPPVCSFWGGIVALQVLKFTGKYVPIRQWLHHGFFGVLPQENVKRTINEKSRYNDLVVLFGDQLVDKVKQARVLVVGAGALGCQLTKTLSLMGFSTSPSGRIHIADDKPIRPRNLSSHSLFSHSHLNLLKCKVACQQGNKINPEMNFNPIKYNLNKETEEVFDEDLWSGIDFVVSVVDSEKSRVFLDGKVVDYEVACFQGSVVGVKCSTDVILPHKTQSHTDFSSPNQEGSISCDYATMRRFPYKSKHAIHWAQISLFQLYFSKLSDLMEQFYSDRKTFIKKYEKKAGNGHNFQFKSEKHLRNCLNVIENQSYENCLRMALKIFFEQFQDNITILLQNFPPDYVTGNQNQPFWKGQRRCPRVINFDSNNALHLQFVQAGANIFARMFGIPHQKDPEKMRIQVERIHLKLKHTKNRPHLEEWNQEREIAEFRSVIEDLASIEVNHCKSFTKLQVDLQSSNNWQFELIEAASNLRAWNYRIDPSDRLKIMRNLGITSSKLLPPITTTVGAICLQIIKFLMSKPVTAHRTMSMNMALPSIIFSELAPPKVNKDVAYDLIMMGPLKVVPGEFSKWDKIEIRQHMLMCELIDFISKKLNVVVYFVYYQNNVLWNSYQPKIKMRQRSIMPVQDVICKVAQKKVYRWKNSVSLGVCATRDEEECILPQIKYFFNWKQ